MLAKWLGSWRIGLCMALIGAGGNSHAAFHLWQITEVYSNASGTVQFIELTALTGGQQFLAGHTITAAGNFTFPANLPGDSSGRKFLIGTDGFAALNVVAPDYVVPNGFLLTANGTINFANADIFSYAALPTDGVLSLNRDMSTATNSPTNFAGAPAITGVTAGLGQVSVAFSPPASNGGSAITSYTASCGVQSASGASSPILVTGLSPGVPLTCRVLATNAVGPGPLSAPSGSVTPLGVPGAPTIGSAFAGDGQVTVNFQPPANDGGSAITGFTATCGGLSASGTGSPLTVFGLANGVAVSCSVIATNAQGNSGASGASNSVTPAGVPGAPSIGAVVAGNAQVTVNFSPPGSDGGSAISSYTATCGVQSASGGGSPIVVAGLANGVAVTCRVIATNAQGNSAPSAASGSVTPAGVPGAPVIGTVVAGNAQVIVNFSPPGSDGGSAISSYTATCGGISASGSGSPLTVTGLTNGVTVTCTVFATNTQGNSAPSAPSVSVVPATVPGAPTIGAATAGNQSASIGFTPPASDGGSPILAYAATCSDNISPRVAAGTSSPLFVFGLVNGSLFTCTVHAVNAMGASAQSGAVLITPFDPGILNGIVSRKLHNGVPRDISIRFGLPPGAPPTIEPRLIGSGHLIVFQFAFDVTDPLNMTVTPNIGNVSSTVVNNEVFVSLTGIPDNQRLTVTLANVQSTGENAVANIGFLAGDVSDSGRVSAGDISAIKARIGQTIGAASARYDLNLSGDIGGADVSVVKARSGTELQ